MHENNETHVEVTTLIAAHLPVTSLVKLHQGLPISGDALALLDRSTWAGNPDWAAKRIANRAKRRHENV